MSKIEKDKPLISVIVPVYNGRQYLPGCIDSILCQSYEKIQIVIVNDGSTDNTKNIVDDYRLQFPDRIKVIHTANSGVSNARLAGIKNSDGEWIGFVDGDDIIESNMYEKLLDNALKYNADISHCGHQTIVNDGERIHYFYNTGKTVVQDGIEGVKDLLLGKFVEPSLCSKLFSIGLFSELLSDDILDTNIRYNEDLLMNYILFKKANRAVYEDFCPYHYMSRNISATRTKFNANKVLDPLKVQQIILRDVCDELEEIMWTRYLASNRVAYDALYGIREYKECCNKIKNILNDNRDKWHLLGRKELLKLKFTLSFPILYKVIYKIYERFFQKKLYE